MTARLFITASLWMTVNFGYSQYFNNNYEISFEKDFFNTAIYTDSSIYVDGVIRIGSTTSGNLIAKLDLNGDTLFVKKYLRDSTIFFGGYGKTIIRFKNSLYCVGVYTKTSPLVNIAYVQKFNLNGDSLAYYEETDTFGVVYNGITVTADQNLAITGYVRPTSSNLDLSLKKFDTLLNPLWTQTFGGVSEDAGWSIDTTSDGGFVIGGLTQSYGAGLRDAYLIKTDSLGNFQWQKTYGGSGYDAGKVLAINDTSILLFGGFDMTSGTNVRLFFRFYDYSGNLISENLNVITKKLLFTPTCIKSGPFFYFNNYCKIDTLSTSIPVANIIKTDLAGNVIWDRYYLKSQNDNYTTGMIQLPDKSLVSSGYLFADGISVMTEDAWLFRVDSMGCFIPGCSVGVDEFVQNEFEINVFPNPSNGVFNIIIQPFLKECSITVTNSFGQNVYSENNFSGRVTQINLENQPKGFYFINIQSNGIIYGQKIVIE